MMIARTSPPAKLNLFLEIPSRRNDGYHEIDTVMTAIDWRDELEVRSIPEPRVELMTTWLPSLRAVAAALGLGVTDGMPPEILRIPDDETNLVVQALDAFRLHFGIRSGFRVRLGKRIPAGAGMGGASSDAAHAIACASQIHQVANELEQLHAIAATIGSDVPFFLPSGMERNGRFNAAHAQGRGERLTPIRTRTSIHFVVAFPPISLSTAAVYRRLRVPRSPQSSSEFLKALERDDHRLMAQKMMNRLAEPALEMQPALDDLIECLWQSGLQPCQLTGSGSACFGIARDARHAMDVVKHLKFELQPGVLLRAAQTVPAAAAIEIEPS